MYVPGVQVMHSASHSTRPARKHGYLDCSSSVNLHLLFGIILLRQYYKKKRGKIIDYSL